MFLEVGWFSFPTFGLALLLQEPAPSFWPQNFATWVDVVAKVVTGLALIVGGAWGLKTYRGSQRLKASEILLKMEEEFLKILPTYARLEDDGYAHDIERVLGRWKEAQMFGDDQFLQLLLNTTAGKNLSEPAKEELMSVVATRARLGPGEIEEVANLDRCLRFFYLCSVLNKDLAVESDALKRAYYYYVGLLVKPAEHEKSIRPELDAYVAEYYPRLHSWVEANAKLLRELRKT